MAHKDISAEVFKGLIGMMPLLDIQFSTRHNAMYGLDDFLNILVTMIHHSGYARGASRMLCTMNENIRVPSSEWFLKKIRDIDQYIIERRCRRILDASIAHARKFGCLKDKLYTLAIDGHAIPRYDKKARRPIVRSKSKKGTSKFETYYTGKLTGSPGLHIGCYLVTKKTEMHTRVANLLKDCRRNSIRLGMVLLDRGFYTVRVMKVIEKTGTVFLMPAVKTAGVKRAIAEYAAGTRKAVSRYTVASAHGSIEINLVIVRKKRGIKGWNSKDPVERHIVFATNSGNACEDLLNIPKEYRKRWGIETGYRVVEFKRCRTCSKNQSVRVFLFFMTLVNANLWMTARHICAEGQEKRYNMLEMSIFTAIATAVMLDLLKIRYRLLQSQDRAGSVMLSPLEIRHNCKGPGPS